MCQEFVGCTEIINAQDGHSCFPHGAFSLVGSAGGKRQMLLTLTQI